MLDEAKEQVTSYLLHRESQSSGDDVSKALARKVDALAERLEQGSGGRGLDQKLDALYGKIDQLASAVPRGGSAAAASGGDGGGPGVSEAALKSAVRPVAEKLEQFDARLKSIDALKEALVPAITKLRDAHAEQHNTQSAGIRQTRRDGAASISTPWPQYFTAIQQQVVAAQQHADAGLRAIIDILRPPQPEAGFRRAGRRRRLARGPLGRRTGPQSGPERSIRTSCSTACSAAIRGPAAWWEASCCSAPPRPTRCRPC